MAKKTIHPESIRKITKVGGASYSVTIPINFIRKLKWREKQKVVVTEKGGKLTIEDWKR